jgi:hypothetical protein
VRATNILRRFTPLSDVLQNATIYYPYTIKNGQRPDIVSFIMYKTVDYDWLLLMFNSMLDPYYSWPLFYDEFNAFLEDKYGSVEASTQQIYQYQKIVRNWTKLYDGTILPEKTLVIDETTYNSLPATNRKLVFAYDYEHDLNESRRQIQIIDSVYIPQIMQEKAKIFSN